MEELLKLALWYEVTPEELAQKLASAQTVEDEHLAFAPDDAQNAKFFGLLDALSDVTILSDRFDEFHHLLNQHLSERSEDEAGDIPDGIETFDEYLPWVNEQLGRYEVRGGGLRVMMFTNAPSDDLVGIVVFNRDRHEITRLVLDLGVELN